MRLNPTKRELLLHRLDSDVIQDCLLDSDLEPPVSEEELDEAVACLTSRVINEAEIDLKALNYVERLVFIDALEGSTFSAGLEDAVATGDISKGKALTIHRVVQDMEDEVRYELGLDISIPVF